MLGWRRRSRCAAAAVLLGVAAAAIAGCDSSGVATHRAPASTPALHALPTVGPLMLVDLPRAAATLRPCSAGDVVEQLSAVPLAVMGGRTLQIIATLTHLPTTPCGLRSPCSPKFTVLDTHANVVVPAAAPGCAPPPTLLFESGQAVRAVIGGRVANCSICGLPLLPPGAYVVLSSWQISGFDVVTAAPVTVSLTAG